MKRMMAIALLALAGFIAAGSADAHGQQPQYQNIAYGSFQQRGACNINGVVYPVAMDYSVWGHDVYNNWFEIGGVTWLRYNIWLFQGNDGERLEVSCW
jgi:hypothetical protein